MATQVSVVSGVNTITWVWTEDRQVGQFANGEWWVVGPITLTSITPADPAPGDGTDLHGTMLNLTAEQQGWSNHTSNIAGVYVQALNIARQLPYVVSATNSVITLQSMAGGAQGFESGAVLTVVDAPVAAGTFRPPMYSSTKPANWRDWTEASLDYGAFQNLTPTSNAPNPTNAGTRAAINYLLIDIRTGGGQGNTNMKITGSGGGAGYGRDIAKASEAALLALNCNYTNAQKRDLLVSVVQRGIDAYGAVLAGYVAPPDGGHNLGRKPLFMVAAAALGDSDMLAKLNAATFKRFQEDAYYIFVDQPRIDTPHWQGEDDYTQAMLGMPDWGDLNRVNRSTPDWTYSGYRYINASPGVGFVLCATLMGLRTALNNEAYFQYIIERYMPIMAGNPDQTGWPRVPNDADIASMPTVGSTNGISQGASEMWNAYFASGGGEPTQANTPVINPASGAYSAAIEATLSSSLADSIHYTTNGSTPSAASTEYTAPIAISANTTLKAISVKAGLTDSAVATATYTFPVGGVVSTSTWPGTTVALEAAQTGNFSLSLIATPAASPINAVVGISQSEPSGYSSISAIARFNPSGNIDAYNGTAYAAVNVLPYLSGVAYTFDFAVDMANQTYSLTVTPDGGSPVVVATDYAFRTPAAQLTLVVVHHDTTSANTITVGSIEVAAALQACSPPSWGETPPGNYSSTQVVTLITNETAGATRYTLDGSDPTASSDAYFTPLFISATTTIKARTFKDGKAQSLQISGTFTIGEVEVPPEQVQLVTVDIQGGTYGGTQEVTPSTLTAGATIYYTTNGSTPTTGSTEYTSGTISVASSLSLKLFAVKAGMTDSAVTTYNYVIGAGEPDPDEIPVDPSDEITPVVLTKSHTNRARIIVSVEFTNLNTRCTGGVGPTGAAIPSDFAAAWRISGGAWQARNGETFDAENAVAITVGTWDIRYTIKPTTYNLDVRESPGGAWQAIAVDYELNRGGAIERAGYQSESHPIVVTSVADQRIRLLI